jgi:transcriptional regulator with XRE-family HTH domain
VSTKAQHSRRYAKLPRLLQQLRDEAGLTQRQLAARLGKPQSWVYKSEAAIRRVDAVEFIEWAEACEVNVDEAFRRLRRLVR